jgi:hypothetical protein
MKKLIVLSNLFLVLLSSCATQKTGTYTDDVYANPKEVRAEEARLAAIEKQRVEERNRRYNDSVALAKQAQKEKDDANPAYQDREFKYDDYYDYEYATRLKRFDNNVSGLSYYDNYYTNSYWYTRNPYNYGVSVYNGYSWWGSSYNNYSYNPSVSFYNSWGWGYGNQFSVYSGYNPYMAGYAAGYNNGFNNGLYGNYYGYGNPYYSPYGYYGYDPYGYGNPYGYGGGYYGYNNPYYGGWGYYNSYDNNSSYTYGPRSSHGGGNSRRTTNPGVNDESYSHRYVNQVAEEQNRAVKFNDVRPNINANTGRPIRVNANGTPIGETGNTPVRDNTNGNSTTPVRDPVRGGNNPVKEPTYTTPVRNNTPSYNNTPVQNTPNEPVKETPVRNPDRPVRPNRQEAPPVYETPTRQNNNTPSFPNTPSNNGGGSTPSGGGHRPR